MTNINSGPDMCKCSDCKNTMMVKDCDHDHGHHNGWEMPPYTEILCPHCDDGGCVDDFWYSEDVTNVNCNTYR